MLEEQINEAWTLFKRSWSYAENVEATGDVGVAISDNVEFNVFGTNPEQSRRETDLICDQLGSYGACHTLKEDLSLSTICLNGCGSGHVVVLKVWPRLDAV